MEAIRVAPPSWLATPARLLQTQQRQQADRGLERGLEAKGSGDRAQTHCQPGNLMAGLKGCSQGSCSGLSSQGPRKGLWSECMVLVHRLSLRGDSEYPMSLEITQPGMGLETSVLDVHLGFHSEAQKD